MENNEEITEAKAPFYNVTKRSMVVKMKGLPYTTKKKEVRSWFKADGVDTKVFLCKNQKTGQGNGIGFAVLTDKEDLDKAMQKNNQDLGGRSIHVTKSCVNAMRKGLAIMTNHATLILMSRVPAEATEETIKEFFSGMTIAPNGIMFRVEYDGSRSGRVLVNFTNSNDATQALQKSNEEILGSKVSIWAATERNFRKMRELQNRGYPAFVIQRQQNNAGKDGATPRKKLEKRSVNKRRRLKRKEEYATKRHRKAQDGGEDDDSMDEGVEKKKRKKTFPDPEEQPKKKRKSEEKKEKKDNKVTDLNGSVSLEETVPEQGEKKKKKKNKTQEQEESHEVAMAVEEDTWKKPKKKKKKKKGAQMDVEDDSFIPLESRKMEAMEDEEEMPVVTKKSKKKKKQQPSFSVHTSPLEKMQKKKKKKKGNSA